MRKYEYKIVPIFADPVKRENEFNELGQDGWAWIGPDGEGYFVFARPIDPNPEGEK